MHREGNYAAVERVGYRVIRLPYGVASLGMIIVLPNEFGSNITRVGARFDANELARVTAALRQPSAHKPVDLALPRFRLSMTAELAQPFRQAGMTLAFDPGKADFSGITGRPPAQQPIAIGRIVHRTVMDVTEGGTEAAAATAVTARASSARSKPPVPFHVNRPFLCYIVDDATGAILFQARVADPR
jgi:serpin B